MQALSAVPPLTHAPTLVQDFCGLFDSTMWVVNQSCRWSNNKSTPAYNAPHLNRLAHLRVSVTDMLYNDCSLHKQQVSFKSCLGTQATYDPYGHWQLVVVNTAPNFHHTKKQHNTDVGIAHVQQPQGARIFKSATGQ